MNTRRAGVTLVEMLIVIGIVGALAALLLAGLGAAREAARRMTCQSNMRQLGLGIYQYANANTGHFPWTYHAGADQSWVDTLGPYEANVDAMRLCPNDPLGFQRVDQPVKGTSYVINEYVAYQTPGAVLRLDHIKEATKLIILFEGSDSRLATDDHVHTSQWYVPGDIAHGRAWNNMIAEINPQRHADSSNYLFADGHVESISLATIYGWYLQDVRNGTNFAEPEQ